MVLSPGGALQRHNITATAEGCLVQVLAFKLLASAEAAPQGWSLEASVHVYPMGLFYFFFFFK